MVPIDYNAFWSSFTPKNRHVGDVSRTRGGTVYEEGRDIWGNLSHFATKCNTTCNFQNE